MNVSLLVNYGDRFGAPVNAVPPALPEQADRSNITQQDTLLMQVLELEYQLLLKAQSVAAKSQVQYKPETFMLSQAEQAQFSSASAKLLVLQRSVSFGSCGERLGSSAATTSRDHWSTPSCTARRGPASRIDRAR